MAPKGKSKGVGWSAVRRTAGGVLVGCVLGTGSAICSRGQSTAPAAAGVQQGAKPDAGKRPTSTPYNGDLSIFESKDRDKRLQIGRVMDLLGIAPGKTVADVGAGSGWFTVRAAERVGPEGSVYAEDINPKAVAYIKDRASAEHLRNVREVLGAPADPKLPPGSLDAVLMLKTYHEIADPVRFLGTLRRALKPGARLGIIDRNGDGTDHGIMPDVIVREAAQAGFQKTATYDFTKADGQDYFMIFEVR